MNHEQKWVKALWLAVVFVILSLPWTYKAVNKLTRMLSVRILDMNGCPNLKGVLLHGLVFLLVVRGMCELNLPGTGKEHYDENI